MRLFIIEILSILYITVGNSDLGLGRLAEKQHSVAMRNMPLTLSVPTRMSILKCPGAGVEPPAEGAKPQAQTK